MMPVQADGLSPERQCSNPGLILSISVLATLLPLLVLLLLSFLLLGPRLGVIPVRLWGRLLLILSLILCIFLVLILTPIALVIVIIITASCMTKTVSYDVNIILRSYYLRSQTILPS